MPFFNIFLHREDPQVHKDNVLLEADALSQLALRCAKSISHHSSLAPSRNPSRNPSRAASRVVSRAVSRFPSLEDISITSPEWDELPSPHVTDDTFDQILSVTNNQDALMAYYYMDDNNEVCHDGPSLACTNGVVRPTMGQNVHRFTLRLRFDNLICRTELKNLDLMS